MCRLHKSITPIRKYKGLKRTLSVGIVAITLPIFSCVTAGCDDDKDDIGESHAVIEAWINSDGYPEVIFTSTAVPGNDGKISDNVINWGKVTISDGENEIIMTGGPSTSYLPPYHYYTYEMTGEPGRTYRITAQFKEMKAEATGYMPTPTPIDSVTVKAVAGNDTLRGVSLHFTAPSDTPAYYYLTIKNTERHSRPLPCMLGTVKTLTPGEQITVPVMHPRKRIEDQDFEAQLSVGEEVIIILNRVTKDVYDFWHAYDNMVNFTSSPFLSTDQSLPGNITGGYGIFSACGSSNITLKISDTPKNFTVLTPQ